MSLQVFVVSASNIPKEKIGKSDPYAEVEFQGKKLKTEVIKSEINPTWNQKLDFDLQGVALSPSDKLVVRVKDWERIGRNKLIGTVDVPLKQLLGGQNSLELTLTLNDANKRPLDATLILKLQYVPPEGAKGGSTSTGETVEDTGITEEEEEEGEEEEEEVEEKVVDPKTGKVTTKKKRKTRGKRRRHRTKLSDKPQDFQVRVKVVECRQLQGSNISPVCQVSVYNHTKQSRVKKSTNTPFWNESFFFDFKASPAELMDELVEFRVYNSRKLRSDSLIGSFKCDIGLIYESAQHSLLNKWLLLTDPEDTLSGPKGYLKMSASVIGPGDQAPSFKATKQDENEDIESNLLRPAGVKLRPGAFMLKLYRGEDIPRMDSDVMEGLKKMFKVGQEKKELVDPYVQLSFAGKQVQSSTLYNNANPEWNEELRLGVMYPSMCERIKLQVMDWDRLTEDDAIGAYYIPVSHISSPGETDIGDDGYLPTFGPCYVNLYGSPREFSELPDEFEFMNRGKGEGMAYRGRLLVELATTIGEHPEYPLEAINNDDVLRVQKYMRRRKYKLHASFYSANMISAIDAPVEFEVSIGNYGNTLDESIVPCSSTTQPTNAVFDGCHYYFLPWGDTKPCVVIDSHWEDISWRLATVNMLLKSIDDLEENLQKIKIAQKKKATVNEQAQLMIALLDQLIKDVSKPLPEPEPGCHVPTDLDHQLRDSREYELNIIKTEAIKLRDSATDLKETLEEVQGFLSVLKVLSVEPQSSIPDVIIWMISGTKRLAYYRIPAHELLYLPDNSGRKCGKVSTIELKWPTAKSLKEKKDSLPGVVCVKIWLGLEKYYMEWRNQQKEGELAVFAETYENQVSVLGNWVESPSITRPSWSDSTGKVKLKKDSFIPPPGWHWEGEWEKKPEISLLYDKDAGHRTYTEDVYEVQARLPAGNWPASTWWTDIKGDEMPARDEISLPEDWQWDDDWQVDLNRAVDEEGFEYCVEATLGGYGPVEKTYHLCRRRRWLRNRTLVADMKHEAKMAKLAKEAAEGWEYAPLFNMKFHAKNRTMDMVRRRRWLRKMVAESPKESCFFSIKGSDEKEQEKYAAALTVPRMFLTFDKSCKYQLRAYIYQARDLPAADNSGLSDPFARVCIHTQSQVTEKQKKTLTPTWDQTLLFEEIEIYGDPLSLVDDPPAVFVEIFDYDRMGDAEFLGRTVAKPLIKLDPNDQRVAKLQWYKLQRRKENAGEMLASFELYLITGNDLPLAPPKYPGGVNLYKVPTGIRPVVQRTGIEVLCWGVRNMKKYQLASVTSPSVEFECGGEILKTAIIKNTKRNPNFDEPLLFFDVSLPKEELYMPPMNIRVRDHRQFGRRPVVGVHTISSLEKYKADPYYSEHQEDVANQQQTDPAPPVGEFMIDMPQEEQVTETKKKSDILEEENDWWSKYYASVGEMDKCKSYLERGYDTLEIYPTELEKAVQEFSEFNDFCSTFTLTRGKVVDDDDDEDEVGEVKGILKVYPLPGNPNEECPQRILSNLPPSQPEPCVIRVYIIRAFDLQPNDPSGLADPYVSVKIGKEQKDNRDDYVPNSINPVFGQMFEFDTVLPIYKDLRIKVKDYDLMSSDDAIGETTIDLENRLLTKYRAVCGLPKTYCVSGPTEWRDCQKPTEILLEYCKRKNLKEPEYSGNTSVTVGNRVYNLADFEKKPVTHKHLGPPQERIALYALNTFKLVPEHVETRPLYNPLRPGIEQGKLELFVDVFPKSLGTLGPAVDVTPRKAKKFVLRCIIWNTKDVILDEESITGEQMSDIYVKGWMSGIDEKQKTDVHYRSLDGEGNFNWRFVFPFEYLPAEQKMVLTKKEHFWSLDKTEQRLPPKLVIQVWDNDKFSADDFLGTVELDLNRMPKPVQKSRQCNLDQLPDNTLGKPAKLISLFEQKRVMGYWPCYGTTESGERQLTGKVEMELEIVTEEEAETKPAGQGRDEPNMNPTLEPPKRPATSFLWFTSPFKSLKYIIWRNYKWYIIGLLIIILVLLLVILFIYSVPGASVNKIFGLN